MATVDRVLPWRRHAPAAAEELAPLIAAFRSHNPKASTALVVRAYEVAAAAHTGQHRIPVGRTSTIRWRWARIVATSGWTTPQSVRALLHDAVEDTEGRAGGRRDPVRVEIAAIVGRRHEVGAHPLRLQGRSSSRPPCARCW